MPVNGLRVNHYDFVALHSMWIIFLKGYFLSAVVPWKIHDRAIV